MHKKSFLLNSMINRNICNTERAYHLSNTCYLSGSILSSVHIPINQQPLKVGTNIILTCEIKKLRHSGSITSLRLQSEVGKLSNWPQC